MGIWYRKYGYNRGIITPNMPPKYPFLGCKPLLIVNHDTAALDLSGYYAPPGPVLAPRAHKNIRCWLSVAKYSDNIAKYANF